jgi:hypothetical protein
MAGWTLMTAAWWVPEGLIGVHFNFLRRGDSLPRVGAGALDAARHQ